jgi:site-specific DNA-methyltransferase (adenine-specific)
VTPYYQDDAVTIYHGDCRGAMADIPASVVVTDPPYGDTSLEWDTWPDGWLFDLSSSTEQLWSFGSMRMWLDRGESFRAAGWKYGQEIIWWKHNGSGFHADRFKRVHEIAMHWYRGKWSDLSITPQYVNEATARTVRRKRRPAHTGHIEASAYRSEDGGPKLQLSVMFAPSAHGHADNETQKPESIVDAMVRYSTNPDDVILDPFMGSGTTLRVAKSLGRRAVGFDVREAQCEAAACRMSGQLDLVEGGAA